MIRDCSLVCILHTSILMAISLMNTDKQTPLALFLC